MIDAQMRPMSRARSWPDSVRVRWAEGVLRMDHAPALDVLQRAAAIVGEQGFVTVAQRTIPMPAAPLADYTSTLVLLSLYFILPEHLKAHVLVSEPGDDVLP